MMDIFTSPSVFIVLLALLSAGALVSVCLYKYDIAANIGNSFFAIFGSLVGVLFGAINFIAGSDFSFSLAQLNFPLLNLTLHIDRLASFFIFIISLIALFASIYGFGYLKHYYGKYNIGVLGLFYNLFIAGMLLVVTAANAIFFLIAWELMSLASYFLVVYEHREENSIKAGFLYLIMTQVGTAFIILTFLLIYIFTGSFDFKAIQASWALIPLSMRSVIFVLALVGFGTKAGIIPLHIWLPSAHPAAPSHVSALMSGVMIKTAIYIIIRIFFDLSGSVTLWWGLVLLVIGSASSLLGVLYALTEHDIKRLLAYHSIENIGIIILGLGSAFTFSALGMPHFALIGLSAALFHTLNHAVFKSLLFLSAGSVINQTHTRNMEEHGGLIKRLPQTAFFFLIGSMAISALPPFNGFFSEWLTFKALFQGVTITDFYSGWIFILATGSLAFTGGLALACFVKAFGVIFLARPRSEEAAHAEESPLSLRFGMGALAAIALLFGILSGPLVSAIGNIGQDLQIFQNIPYQPVVDYLSVSDGFAAVSTPWLLLFLVIVVVVVTLISCIINRRQKITTNLTWDCGTDLQPRMEITSTGFARSIVIIFKRALKPSIQHEVEYHDADSRYMPKARKITLATRDVYYFYLYQPLHNLMNRLSLRAKKIQGGNVNVYILYIFLALAIALFSIL